MKGLNGMFDAILKIGTSGVESENTLTAGGVTTLKSVGSTPIGSVDLTHSIGGSLSFQLLDAGDSSLLASELFGFDPLLNMGPFNKIGANSVGVVSYIWGGAVDGNLQFASGCAQQTNCAQFMTALNNTGMEFDFSFTGSVPEPATVLLLELGLMGISISRIRRQ